METSEARKIPNNDGEIVREIMTDNIINYNIGENKIRIDKIINMQQQYQWDWDQDGQDPHWRFQWYRDGGRGGGTGII